MVPKHSSLRFVLLVGLLAGCGLAAAEDWPQWRGPQRDGTYLGKPWPERLQGEALQPLWRVKLGASYSGPIVVGERVFTTETVGNEKEVVTAFERNTGKELWKVEWKGALTVPFFAWANGSWIRSTPACDGHTLYVAGIRDVLVALDVATGQERWRIDFVEKFKSPLPAFGFVASPLIEGDALFVQAGGGVCKVNKQTGEVLWRALNDGGGMNGSAFSSPIVQEIAGVRQLLVQGREKLAGLALADGGVLWEQSVPAFRGMNILTPTVLDDLIFTSTYGGKTTGYRVKPASASDPAKKFTVESAWSGPAQGYMSSPVFVDGKAYLHLRNQRFACFDLASGEQLWATTPFGKYWSIIARGDRLLALDAKGELLLIQADPKEFKLLDRRQISDDETWAHLALADDQIFIRELKALAVYRWRGDKSGK